jgi:hypothetical protein
VPKRILQFANTRFQPADQCPSLVLVGIGDGQVLDPVVVSDAVQMVDVFMPLQTAPDVRLHDDAMFRATRLAWAGVQPYVAFLVNAATASPTMVLWAAWRGVIAALSHGLADALQPVNDGVLRQSEVLGDLTARQPTAIQSDHVCGRSVEPLRRSKFHASAHQSHFGRMSGQTNRSSHTAQRLTAAIQSDDVGRSDGLKVPRRGNWHMQIIQEVGAL